MDLKSPFGDQERDLAKLIKQYKEEQDHAIQQARAEAQEAKREARELQGLAISQRGLQVNRWLLFANVGLFLIAMYSSWQASRALRLSERAYVSIGASL